MAAERSASPAPSSALVPLALFRLSCRWLSTARGYGLEDPIVCAAKDRLSWAVDTVAVGVLRAADLAVGLSLP